MALWLNRAGSHGEFEKKFLDEGRIYLTWEGLSVDLTSANDRTAIRGILEEQYPDSSKGQITNFTGQIWAFVNGMKPGDWVVLPSKQKPAIHFGIIKGDYTYSAEAEDPYFHYREVDWFAQDIPRTNFDQDILYSFGAFMTVCEIRRNNAENRIHAMKDNGWKSVISYKPQKIESDVTTDEDSWPDLEQSAKDLLAEYLKRADMIVLSQNLFEIPETEIDSTKVLLTLFDGKVVFDSGSSPVGETAIEKRYNIDLDFSGEHGHPGCEWPSV